MILGLLDSLRHYVALARRVVAQTHRRVVLGESVPSSEKLVSIFEIHTDIIAKDRRDTLYGHKLCLATGASGLITDCYVEKGNPADSALAIAMVERHLERYGQAPQQVCFDGAFSSRANFEEIKRLEVNDVIVTKAKGISVDEMAGDKLRSERSATFARASATISFLKRWGWLDSLRLEVTALVPCLRLGVGRDRQPVAARTSSTQLIRTAVALPRDAALPRYRAGQLRPRSGTTTTPAAMPVSQPTGPS